MPTEKEVYLTHANHYELLIFTEDYQNNIPRSINQIRDITGLDIVKLGAGTGRLTRSLAVDAQLKNPAQVMNCPIPLNIQMVISGSRQNEVFNSVGSTQTAGSIRWRKLLAGSFKYIVAIHNISQKCKMIRNGEN